MKKNSSLSPVLGVGLAVIILTAGPLIHRTSQAYSNRTIQPHKAKEEVTVQASGRGGPWVNLSDGRELLTTYEGAEELAQSLQQNGARPLGLTSADFDEDGIPDLVSGYAGQACGILVLRRGNPDSIYPNHPRSKDSDQQSAISNSQSEPPFLSVARVSDLAEAPEFLGAGDFDNDGHQDVIATARGSSALYLIPGTGRGGLAEARRLDLPGKVTAMITGEINRADGLLDVVVAVAGSDGPSVLVFQSPLGAWNAQPKAFGLPDEATALALGHLDGQYETDLAVASGTDLLIIRGRDQNLSPEDMLRDEAGAAGIVRRELVFAPLAMVAGDFGGDHREELALLAEDGTIHLLERADQQPAQTAEEIALLKKDGFIPPAELPDGKSPRPKPAEAKPKKVDEIPAGAGQAIWQKSVTINIPGSVNTQATRSSRLLVAAKVSARPYQDLLVLDQANHQLHIISQWSGVGGQGSEIQASITDSQSLTTDPQIVSLSSQGEPVAVLPMRLNKDALSDLVVLRQGSSTPTAVVSAPSAIFTVNSTADDNDGDCNGASADCTLREAIIAANAAAGADEIRFNIAGAGPHTINHTAFLPAITQPLAIDGTTEPDFAGTPVIELNGTSAGTNNVGLDISATANNCTVRGLAINRFNVHGIQIQGAGSNLIEGNFIGTDPGGTIDRGNTQLGVAIFNSPNNTIGGTAATARNLISGNNSHGVQIATGATGNLVQGNLIGTSLNGTADLGNTSLGVGIFDSPNNTVGGTAAGARNVISGNNSRGVQFSGDAADGNTVAGNLIGTTINGNADLGNTTDGVGITGSADNNTVGGTAAGARNVISGNDDEGVEINTAGTTGNTVAGNIIGLDVTGTVDLGNSQFGAQVITSASSNTIGGTTAEARNIISGNDLSGVDIEGGATLNLVQGNFIGTDITGTLDRGNTQVGVVFFDATTTNNTVGGTAAGARNVISGNNINGVSINTGSTGNQVQGNFIGTDVNGAAELGNTGDGVRISASPNNTVGGTAAGARNVISGNSSDGVEITGAASTGNLVQGNFIGTQMDGLGALGNFIGVSISSSATTNTVGGTVAEARNVISANEFLGVFINTSTGNLVQGNFIGTQMDGASPLGNIVGVFITANNNTIGGTSSGAGNTIAHNIEGVDVSFGTGNAIRGNSIFSNADLGIDLDGDGVTPNDPGDSDAGDNNFQNFPVVVSACNFGGSTIISGTLGSTANTQFALEFFSNTTCDDSGFGEGATLIHSMMVTTNGSGNAFFTVNITPAIPDGRLITATATDPAGNTSEFSQCAQVTSETGVVATLIPPTSLNPVGTSHTVTTTVRVNCSPAVGVTVTFNIMSGPNAGQMGAVTTNALGQASFTYTSNGTTGTDTIQASGSASGMPFSVTAQKTWASATSACNNDGEDILDDATITSTITVNSSLTIADLNVRMFIDHTFDGDLDVTLTSPAGTTVTLFSEVGGGGEDFGSTCSPVPNCVIDDEAATDIENGSAPFIGSFNPGGDEVLSAFDGENAQGTWTLTITDVAEEDEGFLNCWCLEFLNSPTAVKLASFAATGYDKGVFLNWQTGYEVDNLGFRLYRDEAGKRVPVNPQILAGSALVAGARTALAAGQLYGWWDSQPIGKQEISYWLEDIALDGTRTLHGPFKPQFVGGSPPPFSQAALLSQIGQGRVITGPPATDAQRLGPVGASAAAQEKQSELASGSAVKLTIREEGWYRVTQAELLAAGIDPKIDPRQLQLYVEGAEQPMLVAGEDDGRLDAGDVIEFYGVGLDTISTDARVYWLTAGKQTGKRINIVSGKSAPGGAGSFAYTVERKERSLYFSNLRNGERENFFGRVVSDQPVEQRIALGQIDQTATGGASLLIALQGVTDLPRATDHQVKVTLNSQDVGRLIFDGQTHKAETIQVPHSLLREGENVITLTAEVGPGDISLIDYIRITYNHTYTAEQNALRLTAGGGSQTIGGFTTPLIRVFDITRWDAVQEITGPIEERKGGGYQVTVAAGEPRTLLALGADKIKRPASITANQPSSWRQPGNGTDLLIITRRDLMSSIEPLKSLRQSQGLAVAVVDIEDIYDEYSFGCKAPQAVKDFITFAASVWKRNPRFVLLAGDASFDARNYLGFGETDLVPTKLIDTQYMEAASDDWFVDANSDGLPELAVGRLPVRTGQQAAALVAKIKSYESSSFSAEVTLVADQSDGFNFEASQEQLRASLPATLKVNLIRRSQVDQAAAKKELLDSVNRGQKIVSYSGHGSVGLWRGNLLTNADASGLVNRERLPLFVMMTCLNGYFLDVAVDSLAESLMKAAGGGAVAVWASSGMTLPEGQALMSRKMYQLLFNGDPLTGRPLTLGEAASKAKAAMSDTDVRRTWILFGDPSLKLR
jgi:CSLREA domain-containing protein